MYELKTCSVCGATEIKRINTEQHDGLVFGIYKCSSCDAEISAYQKFLKEAKKAEKEASIKEETAAESLAVPAEEHVSRRVVVSVAADVYRKAIGSTIELAAKMDDLTLSGTGTVISKNGYFITNAHVIMELDKDRKDVISMSEEVYGQGGENNYRFTADLIYADTAADIALLKTDPCDSLTPVTFAKQDAFIGESVYAIGNSKGEGLCIVEGIVSDVHRKIGNNDVIMISAPVTNGNSGGPVFNADGELIGIVQSGRKGVSAMNYVIPTKTILDFLNKAKEKEDCDFEL